MAWGGGCDSDGSSDGGGNEVCMDPTCVPQVNLVFSKALDPSDNYDIAYVEDGVAGSCAIEADGDYTCPFMKVEAYGEGLVTFTGVPYPVGGIAGFSFWGEYSSIQLTITAGDKVVAESSLGDIEYEVVEVSSFQECSGCRFAVYSIDVNQ